MDESCSKYARVIEDNEVTRDIHFEDVPVANAEVNRGRCGVLRSF